MSNIPQRTLGRSGIKVSTFGIGCAFAGELLDAEKDRRDGDEEAAGIVKRAVELGVNYLDMARFYQKGDCERRIGLALQGLTPSERKRLVISTKAGREPDNPRVFDAESVRRSVERSLRLLHTNYLDILYLHDPMTDEHMREMLRVGGAVEALEELRESGIIGAIGIGVKAHRFLRAAIDSGRFDALITVYDYTPIRTSAAAIINHAAANGIGVVNASPYSAGLLAGLPPDKAATRRKADSRDLARARAIWSWCRERDFDVGAMAMQFCFRNPDIAATIAGPRTIQELEENVRHATTPLAHGAMEEFQNFIAKLAPAGPGGEEK